MTARSWRVIVGLAVVAMLGAAEARPVDVFEHTAVMESLRSVPPKFREYWLRERGLEDWFLPAQPASPETTGLRLVGKWGRGPAVEVTGQDTLVALTLGSEVALLSFADPDRPRVLSEIQFGSLTVQSHLLDSLLYIGGYGAVEVWSVADAFHPEFRSRIPLGVGDFCVQDTFLYLMRQDTFRVFSVADPGAPRQVGCYSDSATVLSVTGATVVCGHPRQGLVLVDVSDPTAPRRAGSLAVGWPAAAAARGNLCCVSIESGTYPYPVRFVTYDITDPASAVELGRIDNAGGYDVFLDSALAFVSGRGLGQEPFQVISIADSAHPVLVDSLRVTNMRYGFGVWASLRQRRAYVAAEYDGLVLVDMTGPHNLVFDTTVLKAASSEDVWVDGDRCYVANDYAGLQLLDVSNPALPVCIATADTAGTEALCQTVAARDSFAFAAWQRPYLRTFDVSDPSVPVMAGACDLGGFGEDMALRDSFLYVAQHYRLQVVNVARPRQPRVVGTCNMGSYNWGLDLQDTLAYVGSWSGLIILNIARPQSPFVVSTTGGNRTSTYGVAVRDSFVLVPSAYETLWVYNAADPATPYPVAGAPLGDWGYDAEMVDDSTVLVGCRHSIKLVSVANPVAPRVTASYPAPSWVRRVVCADGHLYACCNEAGVLILHRESTGVKEASRQHVAGPARLAVRPNPARGIALLYWSSGGGEKTRVRLFDATGRTQIDKSVMSPAGRATIDLSRLPAGVYFAEVAGREGSMSCRFVKQ